MGLICTRVQVRKAHEWLGGWGSSTPGRLPAVGHSQEVVARDHEFREWELSRSLAKRAYRRDDGRMRSG